MPKRNSDIDNITYPVFRRLCKIKKELDDAKKELDDSKIKYLEVENTESFTDEQIESLDERTIIKLTGYLYYPYLIQEDYKIYFVISDDVFISELEFVYAENSWDIRVIDFDINLLRQQAIEYVGNALIVDSTGTPTYLPIPSQVEANPTLAGTEAELTGLEVHGVKYKLGGGAPKLYRHAIRIGTEGANANYRDINIFSYNPTPCTDFDSVINLIKNRVFTQADYSFTTGGSTTGQYMSRPVIKFLGSVPNGMGGYKFGYYSMTFNDDGTFTTSHWETAKTNFVFDNVYEV